MSIGADVHIGIAGWIIDSAIGRDADIDEETAKIAIGDLFERQLAVLTATRRLEITAKVNGAL